MAAPELVNTLGLELNKETYQALLSKMIAQTEKLQNNPPEFVPQEGLIVEIVKDFLGDACSTKGGPLEVRHLEYVEGRGNLVIKYPGTTDKTLTLIGMHMDVVPAKAEDWERNPFEMIVEGDKMYGRGVTDCLGHVALVATLMKDLAEKKPALDTSIIGVFIANEENSSRPGVGVDAMVAHNEIAECRNGPCFWMDSADVGPTLGTGAAIEWKIKVTGKPFHSGLPHKAVNPIELANEVVKYVQERFYKDFARHPREVDYNFQIPSSMKPTQIKCSEGSLNQIPSWVTVAGDIRATPFYDVHEIIAKVKSYVEEVNKPEVLATLPTQGVSKYVNEEEGLKGIVEVFFEESPYEGIACDIDSDAHKVYRAAVEQVKGKCTPFSITGSLPLVRDLQKAGFDIQITGYGRSASYHADNEYGEFSEFADGYRILSTLISTLNKQ